MCGVAGFSGRFERRALEQALTRIAHRGPDDSGLWLDERAEVALGHRRLSILDLTAAGHQPMASTDHSVVIAYNGEIYNFRELREGLTRSGHRFRSQSDTEVLLQLYLSEGEAMLARLNGIFAFALWDARTQMMLLARDGFGVKPMYYAQTPDGVAFGSEIKALLAIAPNLARSANIDPLSLHRYLSFLWCPGDGTPLKQIRKLEPGQAMTVRQGRIERHWTWYRQPAQRGAASDLTEPEAVAGAVQHLRTAVQRQMIADVPVGAFLSGGLDSSAVVTFARELDPGVRCFTIELAGGQEDGMADDLPYAQRAAAHLQVKLDIVRVDAAKMAQDLPAMVEQLDEPLADPAPLNVLYISRLARENGIKVLLSGGGGDDLFSGYRRHRALMAERYWAWLPSGARALLKQAAGRFDRRNALGRRIAKAFAGADLDATQRIVNYFLWADSQTLSPLYTTEFLSQLERETAETPLLAFLETMPPGASDLERMLALEQRFFLGDHNLLYTDKMSMAAGVEVRVPFLDPDLAEFAARIPSRLKQRGTTGKWVLKKAMEPYLPREIIYRPKTGFGAPLRRWLRLELRGLLHELLSPAALKNRGWFDPEAVTALIQANDSGKVDATYTVFGLMNIELWCRKFLDAQGFRQAAMEVDACR